MLKNFTISTEKDNFNDILHEDGSMTYDTVYGQIHIKRPFVVNEINCFLLGHTKRSRFALLLEQLIIDQKEFEQIMTIID